MWTLHTANEEHWVPVKTVASFKRMREFQALGNEWVADALKKSEELEVDAAGENVRRRTEVQPPKGQFERSVYAVRCPPFRIPVCARVELSRLVRRTGDPQKGFGKEEPGLQKKLEDFFDNR